MSDEKNLLLPTKLFTNRGPFLIAQMSNKKPLEVFTPKINMEPKNGALVLNDFPFQLGNFLDSMLVFRGSMFKQKPMFQGFKMMFG